MISIVLGSMFGDEGKGLVTNHLAHKSQKSIVVRFSGGQQAGHTVMHGDIKHVFSNFGSGALVGAPSYFSEHTCIYPVTIKKEKDILTSAGANTDLFVHPLAFITTPWDIAYNKYKESKSRHGSVGLGIAATFKRNIETHYRFYAVDTLAPQDLQTSKLAQLVGYYLRIVPEEDMDLYSSFIKDEELFLDLLKDRTLFKVSDYLELVEYEDIIFEGSQGILLDMDHGVFPNVTYSNTTSKNALEICKFIGVDEIDVYYVTRCYQTRHGNGHMSPIVPVKLINNRHEINVPNEWQGIFKVTEMDYNLLNYSLEIDNLYSGNMITNKNLVVTCIDQRPGFNFDLSKINRKFDRVLYSDSPYSNLLS